MFKRAKYIFLALFVMSLLLSSAASPVFASKRKSKALGRQLSYISTNYKEPKFSKCPHPGGIQVAGYPEGWHWIVGESTLRWGSDYVFAQTDGNYVQCFCAKALSEGGSTFVHGGIQTSWLKVSNIDSGLATWLQTKGWILVPNGADFGLAAEPYLAKNSSYSCDNSCVTDITQKNTTVVDVTINEEAETGKNTTNSNTGDDVEVNTGEVFNFAHIEIFGGNNSIP